MPVPSLVAGPVHWAALVPGMAARAGPRPDSRSASMAPWNPRIGLKVPEAVHAVPVGGRVAGDGGQPVHGGLAVPPRYRRRGQRYAVGGGQRTGERVSDGPQAGFRDAGALVEELGDMQAVPRVRRDLLAG